MVLIAILLAKLLDPILALVCILGGLFAVTWAHVAIWIVVGAAVQTGVLHMLRAIPPPEPLTFATGLVAAAIWCAATFRVHVWWMRRKVSASSAAQRDS